MNKPDVKTELTVSGYMGLFRLAWRTDFYTVQEPNGSPSYFKSPKDAELAAWRTLNSIEQTAMVRSGTIISLKEARKQQANRIFRNGREIKVETRA